MFFSDLLFVDLLLLPLNLRILEGILSLTVSELESPLFLSNWESLTFSVAMISASDAIRARESFFCVSPFVVLLVSILTFCLTDTPYVF